MLIKRESEKERKGRSWESRKTEIENVMVKKQREKRERD